MMRTAARAMWIAVLALLGGAAAFAQEPVLRLDFGTSDSPVEVGFTQVTAETAYSPALGYGWGEVTQLKEADQGSGSALQRDFIYGYGAGGSLPATFVLDLEPGRYQIALLAGDMKYNRSGLPFDVLLDGRVAIQQWHNRQWEFRLVPVEAREEPVRITFRSSEVQPRRYSWWHCNGIVVLDADTEATARDQMDVMFAAMREAWYAEYEEVFPEEDPARGEITDADRERGYVAFARDYLDLVYPGTVPSNAERRATLSAWATPGEYEPVSFGAVPLRDLGECQVSVSELVSGPKVISPDRWDIRIAGILRQRQGRDERKYLRGPKILYPGERAKVGPGDTRWWWLTVHVPEDQPPGWYSGEVTFDPGSAEPWTCPLRLRVLPFTIERPEGEMFGMYYGTHYAMYPENRDLHFADMREHLIDTITLSQEAPAGGWVDGELQLDFSVMDDFIASAQRHGLTGDMPWGGVRRLPGMIPGDLSDEQWDERYKQLLEAAVAHGEAKGWPKLLCYPVDEPSNNAERIERAEHLLGLAREVPGAYTYCTPNAIEGGLRLLPLIDYACWQHLSANAQTREATLDEGATFWYYSSNYGARAAVPRFRSGFLRWRLGATGMLYWHYNAYVGSPYDDLDAARSDMFVSAPTPEGPIPTIGWECEREGIEDVWYLRKLEGLIEAAPAAKADEAAAAQATLDELRGEIVPDGKQNLSIPEGFSTATFHRFRRRIAAHIIALQ
ncbi:MAG: glycoside hydrolase domain-containing protein [Armatimonadota bacterium]